MIASGWQEVQVVRQNSRRTALSKGGQAAHLTTATRDQIVARLKEGEPVGRIAAEFEVAKSTVYRLRSAAIATVRPAHAPTERVSFRISAGEMEAFDEELARAGFKDRSDGCCHVNLSAIGEGIALVGSGDVRSRFPDIKCLQPMEADG